MGEFVRIIGIPGRWTWTLSTLMASPARIRIWHCPIRVLGSAHLCWLLGWH